jgi:hypothetical protein
VLSPAAGGCRWSLPLLSTSHAHRFGGVNRLTGHDGRVTGVVTGEGEDEPAIYADLVVDGSGCGSRDGAWLEALGGAAPPVAQVRIDMGYASRLLHRTPGQLPDRTWIATLGHAPAEQAARHSGAGGRRALADPGRVLRRPRPTGDAGFLAFADTLPTGDIPDLLRQAEPLTPIARYTTPSEQWRHFKKLRRPPASFVAIGDAVCSFNPIYGPGMSSAALQAAALGRCVANHGLASPALPRRFYRSAAKSVTRTWTIAAGGDSFYPETAAPGHPRWTRSTPTCARRSSPPTTTRSSRAPQPTCRTCWRPRRPCCGRRS